MIANTTTTTPTPATGSPPPGAPPLPDLATTTSIPLIGSLRWLVWPMVLPAIVYAIALASVARWGEVDDSLWSGIYAGWQRWPIGATGVTIVVFAKLFVTNGLTRRSLATASLLAGVAVSMLSATLVTAGYAVEWAVYAAEDWPQLLESERKVSDIGLGTLWVVHAIGNLGYFVGGWLVGLAFHRLGWYYAVPALPLVAAPLFAIELLLAPAGSNFDVLADIQQWSLWASVPAALAIVVATALLARRLTRELEFG